MSKMKIIARAALLAALLLLLSLMIWKHVQTAESDVADIVEITLPPAEETPLDIISEAPIPIKDPEPAESPVPSESPQVTPAASDYFCTLTINSKEIMVLNGVEEEMLKQHPGWLPSSVMPGKDGIVLSMVIETGRI